MLRIIERVTKQRIEPMTLPSVDDVNEQRVLKFKERITGALESEEARAFRPLLETMENERNVPAIEIAAALAALLQGSTPFLLPQRPERAGAGAGRSWNPEIARSHDENAREETSPDDAGAAGAREPRAGRARADGEPRRERNEHHGREERAADDEHAGHGERPSRERREKRAAGSQADGPPMETFRIEVGHAQGVLPGNIVGAIANEAGLDGKFIGHIDIREDHSFVDLPEGMPKEIFRELKKVKVRGAELRISRVDGKPPRPEVDGRPRRRPRPGTPNRADRADRPNRAGRSDRTDHGGRSERTGRASRGDHAGRTDRADRPRHRASHRHTGGRRT